MADNVDLDVIKRAYGWSIAEDGEVTGLVSGDMGYAGTGIVLPLDHLAAVLHDNHPDIKKTLSYKAGFAEAINQVGRHLASEAWKRHRAGDLAGHLAIFEELPGVWKLVEKL